MPDIAPHSSKSPSRIFLLRHGQSLANVQGLIASSMRHAGDAFGLTETGREQVRRSIGAAMAEGTLPRNARLVSSPLLRARETAEVAAGLLGGEVRIDARLIERGFGDLELGADDQYEQVWAVDRIDPTHTRFGVESVAAIVTRMAALLRELDAQAGEVHILCTHGDVASTVLCAAGGQPLTRHREVGATENGELRMITDHDIGRTIPMPSTPLV